MIICRGACQGVDSCSDIGTNTNIPTATFKVEFDKYSCQGNNSCQNIGSYYTQNTNNL